MIIHLLTSFIENDTIQTFTGGINMAWHYQQPVDIYFGNHQIEKLGDFLATLDLSDGILVCDRLFVDNGLSKLVLEYAQGRLATVFSDIVPNPTIQNIDDCARMMREQGSKFAVALGGGSALDCAKAACSLARTEHSIREYLFGGKSFTKDRLPLIAVPTTSGTGSEVTMVAVISDPDQNRKLPLASENFYPNYAIIDPTLTISVPPSVTASTGIDVLAHALEGFWSRNHQPICDATALHAARLVFEYLLPAYHDGKNLLAREKMSEASIMAGLAFGQPKTTGSHACSFTLTGRFHMPHGEACALTLDAFARINAEAENGRLQDFARQLGFQDVDEMADRIHQMKQEMRLACTLQEAGINLDELDILVAESFHPNMKNNPVTMDPASMRTLYLNLN
jgi:alcohol dehydrogenase class IV